MKCLYAILMAASVLLFPYAKAVAFGDPAILPAAAAPALNVNERYVVESVGIKNWRGLLSRGLAREMKRLEGRPFRPQSADVIQKHIEYEFPGYRVLRVMERGSRPQHVRVLFELEKDQRKIDLRSPRVLYSSAQQFSFGVDAVAEAGPVSATAGYITDNDERVERFEGFRGGFLLPVDKSGRFKFALAGENYATRWHQSLAESPERYSSRNNIEPSVLVQVGPGLDLQAGLSFQQLNMLAFSSHTVESLPSTENDLMAAGGSEGPRNLSANAFFTTLRYTKRWLDESPGGASLDAGYTLRAASSSIGADFGYRRQLAEARLTWRNSDLPLDGASISVHSQYGHISGEAPIFDRFVLGNSRTLRGWNRFALAPAGANNMGHIGVDARYRHLRLCYDTGTIWNSGRPIIIRHSAGVGLSWHSWTAMVALPLRGSSIEPVFLVGMNF